jgi:hypothetical protein
MHGCGSRPMHDASLAKLFNALWDTVHKQIRLHGRHYFKGQERATKARTVFEETFVGTMVKFGVNSKSKVAAVDAMHEAWGAAERIVRREMLDGPRKSHNLIVVRPGEKPLASERLVVGMRELPTVQDDASVETATAKASLDPNKSDQRGTQRGRTFANGSFIPEEKAISACIYVICSGKDHDSRTVPKPRQAILVFDDHTWEYGPEKALAWDGKEGRLLPTEAFLKEYYIQKALGENMAVDERNGVVRAPVNGKVRLSRYQYARSMD